MGSEGVQQVFEGVVDLATPTSSALGLGLSVAGRLRLGSRDRAPTSARADASSEERGEPGHG
jgi:hypothetical protein